MNRGSRVDISRLRYGGTAECEGCDLRPDCTRERVRQHVAQTGHVARFIVEDVTVYRPKVADR